MDASQRILKINSVLLDEGWFDNLTTSIANKFGVGDPEAAVAERFGRGTSKRDLEAMKADPTKQTAWMGQHGQVKKEIEDVEGKLERAKEGTKFAATTLGTMGAGSAIALGAKALPAAAAAIPGAARVSSAFSRISGPVSRFMASERGAITARGLGQGLREVGSIVKANPYKALALAGAISGGISTVNPTATRYIDTVQDYADFAGMIPGGVGAKNPALKLVGKPIDIASAGIDVGQAIGLAAQGKWQRAGEQAIQATTRGLSSLISSPAKSFKTAGFKTVGDLAIHAVPQLVSPGVVGKSASQVNPREPSDPGYNKEFDELKKRQEQETQRGTQELKDLGVPGLTRRTSTSAKPPTMLASATRLGESSIYPDMETRRADQLARIAKIARKSQPSSAQPSTSANYPDMETRRAEQLGKAPNYPDMETRRAEQLGKAPNYPDMETRRAEQLGKATQKQEPSSAQPSTSANYPDMETRRAEQLGRISQQNPPVAQSQQNPPFVQKSTGWGNRFKNSELSVPEQSVRNEILFIQQGIKRPTLTDMLKQKGNWG
jgi:hypothetical protein